MMKARSLLAAAAVLLLLSLAVGVNASAAPPVAGPPSADPAAASSVLAPVMALPSAAPPAAASPPKEVPAESPPATPPAVAFGARAILPPSTRVKQVTAVAADGSERGVPHGCLGDTLLVEMETGDVAAISRYALAKGRKLALFIDGMLLSGLALRPMSVESRDVLRVELVRTPDNRDVWGALLGGRAFSGRKIAVQIGLDDGSPLSEAGAFQLSPFPHRSGFFIVIMALFVLGSTAVLSTRTTMLRDGATADGKLGTFSLSRVQAALWFAQVVMAFLWIWSTTGEADTITESSLALLGIGSATALGGVLVDQSGEAKSAPVQPSQGLINDLLTDDRGYALYRFQMVVWSVVLSVLFWSSVYKHLAMPDFSATVLGLMGISSGTYLGFKVPEKKQATAPQDESKGGKEAP
ncbi:MAG: hypothetical protein U0359_18145 [Byssovorax sp.]